MKHLTLFSLLFLSSYLLYSQGINIVGGDLHNNEGVSIVATGDDEWFVLGKSGFGSGFTPMPPFMAYLRSTDEQIANFGSIFHEGSELTNVSKVTYDEVVGNVYFIISQDICDVGLPNQLRSFGTYNWNKELPGSFTDAYTITIVPGAGVIYGNKDGSRLTWERFVLGSTDFTDAWPEEDLLKDLQHWRYNTFLGLSNTALYAFSYNVNGATLTHSYTGDSPILAVRPLSDSTIVIVHVDELAILNTELQIQQSIVLENGNGTRHLAADSLGVYLLRGGNNIAYFYTHDLQEIASTPTTTPSYQISNMAVKNGRISITGATYLTPTNSYFVPTESQLFVQTYTANGPDITVDHDLMMEEISFDDAIFSTPSWSDCNNGIISNLKVTVTNNGQVPIYKILLKYETDICPGICPGFLTRDQLFTDLNLQAGETTTLTFGDLELFALYPSATIPLCIKATAPDHPLENDLTNNNVCETIVVNDLPHITTAAAYNIYPNPAQNELFIDLGTENQPFTNVSVNNMLGQLVYQQKIDTDSRQVQLDLQSLPKGQYLLRLQGISAQYTTTFIHQ